MSQQHQQQQKNSKDMLATCSGCNSNNNNDNNNGEANNNNNCAIILCGSKLNADDNDEVESGSRKAEALSGHGTHCFLRALHMIFLSCCCCYNRIFSVQENREISVIVDDNK